VKIQICSDLHIRSHNDSIEDYMTFTDADVLVVAGDLCPMPGTTHWLKILAEEYPQVIFVAGNHEFYGTDLGDLYDLKWAFRYTANVHILENESVTIDGKKFFGGTLWGNVDDNEIYMVTNCLNDFRLIKDFTVGKSVSLYNKFTKALVATKDVDVVISHFGASKHSIHKDYKDSNINSYFCSDYIDVHTKPYKLWIHGHVHSSFDYVVNGTRVICNPKGYGLENCHYYDPRKIVCLD